MEKNYQARVTLRTLAAAIGYHPAHLCKKFRAELGSSFYEYLL